MTNAASLYQGAAINTASPAELTLMLYNGAIKFCNLALIGMEEEDIMKAHNNLMQAERIIALEDIRGIRDVWTQVMKVAKIA